MAKQFPAFEASHTKFIEEQHMFFVSTAATDGRVNVSPKGMDSLRVLGPNRIIWRNFTGSGNETAGHLLDINRMTLMWCSFGKRPLILRAYGTARTLHPRDQDFAALSAHFPDAGAVRQIYDVSVEMVQNSCGYAVPQYELVAPRDTLEKWAEDRGPDGVTAYWKEKNQSTIDGFPTHVLGQYNDS
ncbi:pyridoxamine 5'-phosphate oxidase family protein [Shimia abyssi]|uniref:Pyridoxamine 5'-phosphate oxidase n=1 Tax=Shimia abyssi TaxID=1662395 RepID=A0A2P8FJM8_9RHOB|nr:pyridoxamine 5'-phosphate oxidase family protein [Shimia abyssi]PSL21879.1 pyridoxamine 5'-phosphate oxidase [Shimia abyssi]